ncbi:MULTISPECIES: subclass B3 metallo-beta-lactamase [unclassified Janthinobacterium]|uniref:subclass B3 metallo-beta-lactamase n=1 Tax=unclassified Janthinobacterium TaxID=2610881 RepID=UPI00161EF28D|nr:MULTISPECIES: subclass B3 metallo-beta-lactamase [unclassified Janthinobacterium]MBB5370748.1 metallo-beta-lactamase class B [Janthinobacterium sp. K2C7]MBB5383554.1 metallo-beta-lactamase class B [Janthinobacterium sp. K2Li3]MBB5389008.1 metallo-beta-lactamase class B [Janthinobacterium sp. K2E3]
MQARTIFFSILFGLSLAPAHAATTAVPVTPLTPPDPLTKPIASPYEAQWNRPQQPARIYGNTYYVGVGGLSVVLIHTEAGLILIDGALPQSVAMIEASIRQLGFRVEDIKYILNTEAHFDHSGGIAALARDSGAVVVASPLGAQALRAGRVLEQDPQAGDIEPMPAVAKVSEIIDGGTVKLGAITITAHHMPGHTPGSTSWTWVSCEAGGSSTGNPNTCLNVVFGASLNAVAADDFHFLADANHGDLTPDFRRVINKFSSLPCDILITSHPDHSGADQKLVQLLAGAKPNPFIDPQACRKAAATFEARLEKRIAKEKAAAK